MEVKEKTQIELNLSGDDVPVFKSVLKAIIQNQKAIGFNKCPLTEKQIKLIEDIDNKINP